MLLFCVFTCITWINTNPRVPLTAPRLTINFKRNYRLQTYGMNGNILQWFKSYLYDRKQKVLYKDMLSKSFGSNAGVPQGSVLWPLLFFIYVNDVAHNMLSFCRLYADDNSIQYADKNINNIECTCMLNHDLKIMGKWSKGLLLQFNPNKTKVLIFGKTKHNLKPSLFFQDCELEFVSSLKHLGLLFFWRFEMVYVHW